MLPFDCENGQTLFKASKNSMTDEAIFISKAVKIIHKLMFEKVEIFNGDFSEAENVSFKTVQLIPLILYGNSCIK